MFQLHSLIMAKEASLCLLFLLISSCSGALVGFSYGERGRDTHADAGSGTISSLEQSKVSSSSQIRVFGTYHRTMESTQLSERVSKYLAARGKRIAALNVREDFSWKEVKRREIQSKRRSLDETITNTVYPTPTIITPPDTPTIITVPSSTNPVTISSTSPAAAVPVNVPSTTPTPVPTNPATTVPVTNPVTSYPPPSGGNVTVPAVTTPQAKPPPANTNTSPSTQGGQSWCVAKTGAPQASLQSALDYACGMGGADCSQIQPGGSCYSPVTLQNHASFAFNSYYQKKPAPTSCDFGGTATLVNTNPSSGSCIFPSSASSTTAPMISSPTPPTHSTPTPPPPPSLTTPSPSTPTTYPPSIPIAPPTSLGSGSGGGRGTSGYGSPPSVLNSSNPAASGGGIMPAGFGSDSPPVVNTSSASHSSLSLRPFTGRILIISFVTAILSLHP